jgi:hypothetical protein
MKRPVILSSLLVVLSIFSCGLPSASLAGDRLRPLYVRTNPSEQITVTKSDIRIGGVNRNDKTVCVIWDVDIASQLEGEMPLTIDIYDRNNEFLYQHEEVVILQRGTNNVRGQKWLRCPEYLP